MDDLVTITCYNKTRQMSRQDAMRFYFEGMMSCEGAEQERYANIYTQLRLGQKVCKDV